MNCQGLEIFNEEVYCFGCVGNNVLAEDKTFCCE